MKMSLSNQVPSRKSIVVILGKQLLFALLLCVVAIHTLQAQSNKPMFEWQDDFLYKVKNIDEFFERFNHSETTLLTTVLKQERPDLVITREKMLRSLFSPAKK